MRKSSIMENYKNKKMGHESEFGFCTQGYMGSPEQRSKLWAGSPQ